MRKKKINFKSRVWIEQQDFVKQRWPEYPQGSSQGARRIDGARNTGVKTKVETHKLLLRLLFQVFLWKNVQVCDSIKKRLLFLLLI